jgi:hypothetical protein
VNSGIIKKPRETNGGVFINIKGTLCFQGQAMRKEGPERNAPSQIALQNQSTGTNYM